MINTVIPQGSRAWYGSCIAEFLEARSEDIVGLLAQGSGRANRSVDPTQTEAWLAEISTLKEQLAGLTGQIFLEFAIPRMGRRIDAVLLIGPAIILLEFKVGARRFDRAAVDQVWDYALDLKNFHKGSHEPNIVPVLVATGAEIEPEAKLTLARDGVGTPLACSASGIRRLIDRILGLLAPDVRDWSKWEASPYKPTPTIVEAALALYARHTVEAIARHDADAENVTKTSGRIEELIEYAKQRHKKVICFVTGVPGAGKTLVGLNVATKHRKNEAQDPAVYLSGNGPLVMVLREALTRDEFNRRKEAGESGF